MINFIIEFFSFITIKTLHLSQSKLCVYGEVTLLKYSAKFLAALLGEGSPSKRIMVFVLLHTLFFQDFQKSFVFLLSRFSCKSIEIILLEVLFAFLIASL